MKSILTTFSRVMVGAGLLVACSFGSTPAAQPASRPVSELKELASVEQFLGLSDAELDQIQQVLARIRAMKPAERATLRTEIEKYRQLPDAQRQQLRQGWGWMPREIQDAWREMMQGVTEARHTEIQTKLQTLSSDEKMAFRRKLTEDYLKEKAAKK